MERVGSLDQRLARTDHAVLSWNHAWAMPALAALFVMTTVAVLFTKCA